MTRKHTTKKQQYWPGSNIPKSTGNAFDWKNTAKGIFTGTELNALQAYVKSQIGDTSHKPSIPTFSKAQASRFTNA